MSCSASLSSSTSRQPRGPRNGQGFDDCADDETASEILHNRAIRIRHEDEKKLVRHFDENSANAQLEASSSATQFENLQSHQHQ